MDKIARLTERLELNKFKLQTILDITKGINDNLPISQLVSVYRSIMEGELELSKLLLYAQSDTGWNVLLQYGDDTDHNEDLARADLSSYKDITVLNTQQDSPVVGFDIIIPVHHESRSLAYLFLGDFDDQLVISPIIKHMNFIQTITNVLVVAIENKRLVKESIRQERLRRELELAAEMQAMLVPTTFEVDEHVEVHALYYPHQEVGGDYYDHFKDPKGRHFFCIADVSGKGISAAFLMANFQARLRVMAEVEEDLTRLIHDLNGNVVKSTNGDRFITFFIAVYDPTDRTLNYVNAGHNPPLLRISGKDHWLTKGCMGLGMLDEIPKVSTGQIEIGSESTLICFTDGLIEVENDSGEEYGEDRIATVLDGEKDSSAELFNQTLKKDFDQFRGSNPPHDDFAILSVRFF